MAKCLVILILILQLAENAEANAFFNLNGLSFPCKSCKILSSGICQFTLKNEAAVISCDRLFSKLLNQELRKSDSHLTEISLLRRSLAAGISQNDSSKILKLLLSKPETDLKHFQKYTEAFIKNYRLIKKLIAEKNLSSQQIDKLVKIISISTSRKLQMLMPLVANYYNRWTMNSILNSLSSTLDDLEVLNLYKQSIKLHSLKRLQVLSSLVDKLNSCALDNGIKRLSCLNQLRGAVFKRYLEKLYLHEALRFVSSDQISAVSSLRILSTTSYGEFANKNLYDYVYNHLSLSKDKQNFETGTSKMLNFLAIYHEGIAAKLNKRHETDWNALLPFLALLILLALCLALLKKISSINQNHKLRSSELQHLMQFFDLPVWASRNDLRKKYREKIKTLHPDSNQIGSNDEDFRLTCKNYKKACALIKNYDCN